MIRRSLAALGAIQVITISDYAVPNAALDAGDLDANSFQNLPIGKKIVLPMATTAK